MKITHASFLVLTILCAPFTVRAETVPALVPAVPVSMAAPAAKSLFYSSEELQAILQAVSGYVAPTSDATKPIEPGTIPMGPRSLKLAGIVYNSDKDWVIWFNGERIHPKNLPENIKGLIVKKDRIALRWLDVGTNRIISLVLLPHQQYNIDTDTITTGTD